ncbi:MAG: hypothetical protein K0S71_1862 [Clostridia bacterium]|jgi:hypothetical protein|nr:hypothetical protein [Clostridia bacterium]
MRSFPNCHTIGLTLIIYYKNIIVILFIPVSDRIIGHAGMEVEPDMLNNVK